MEPDSTCRLRTIGPEETLAAACAGAPLALLLFGTASCAPCQALRAKIVQSLEERASTQGRTLLDAVYIPLDEHPALAAQAGILAAPTIRLYAGGRLWSEASGCFSLEAFLGRTELIEERLHESR